MSNNSMMHIAPLEDADFSLVVVKTTNECTPTPHCKIHGAMNKMNVLDDGGGYWRCNSLVGRRKVMQGNSIGYKELDRMCNAGCIEIRTSQ